MIRLHPIPATEVPTKTAWHKRAHYPNVVVRVEAEADPRVWWFQKGPSERTHTGTLEADGTIRNVVFKHGRVRHRLFEQL